MNQDAGVRVVREVSNALQIDPEWSEWADRGFTWWAHRLAQRVWAEVPIEEDGLLVGRVVSETDLFVIPEDEWIQLTPVFEHASTFATMSGFVWDQGVLRLRCSMSVHDETQPFVAKLLKLATLDQVVLAEQTATGMSQLSPLRTGQRQQPDEMLGAIEGLPGKEGPSAWAGSHMAAISKMLTEHGVFSMGDRTGLTAEFPYGEDGGPAVAGGSSNLLTVTTEERHPRMGSGVLMRLSLREPPMVEPREALAPLQLNQLEASGECDAHFLGSWCSDPAGGSPTFVSFLPSALSGPETLLNLVLSMGIRSQWVAGRL
jgi:hypothetical protein